MNPDISKSSQGVKFLELLKTEQGRPVRIRIESDAYANQSSAVIELFDGDKWNEVWRIPAGSMETPAGLYARREWKSAVPFRADRAELIAKAERILGEDITR